MKYQIIFGLVRRLIHQNTIEKNFNDLIQHCIYSKIEEDNKQFVSSLLFQALASVAAITRLKLFYERLFKHADRGYGSGLVDIITCRSNLPYR